MPAKEVMEKYDFEPTYDRDRGGWDPLAGLRQSRGADVSADPLSDLMNGKIWTMPAVYPDTDVWLRDLTRELKKNQGKMDESDVVKKARENLTKPIWDVEMRMPVRRETL